MSPKEPLETYKSKRDFEKTPEPAGGEEKELTHPIYVIQKHDASHLHYDLRLEMGGVLKSWAVPKGPSPDPKVKRLAMPTEDHPIGYANFEGVIPEGQYGGGTVMVWDIGTYRNLREEKPEGHRFTMEQSYDQGKIEVFLEGKKLKGSYALIRTGGMEKRGWLFFKMKEPHEGSYEDIAKAEPDSALTGRTMDEIAKGG
jgi:DNA ligase D-like protein (predicted 3'-phosphoesterase)